VATGSGRYVCHYLRSNSGRSGSVSVVISGSARSRLPARKREHLLHIRARRLRTLRLRITPRTSRNASAQARCHARLQIAFAASCASAARSFHAAPALPSTRTRSAPFALQGWCGAGSKKKADLYHTTYAQCLACLCGRGGGMRDCLKSVSIRVYTCARGSSPVLCSVHLGRRRGGGEGGGVAGAAPHFKSFCRAGYAALPGARRTRRGSDGRTSPPLPASPSRLLRVATRRCCPHTALLPQSIRVRHFRGGVRQRLHFCAVRSRRCAGRLLVGALRHQTANVARRRRRRGGKRRSGDRCLSRGARARRAPSFSASRVGSRRAVPSELLDGCNIRS